MKCLITDCNHKKSRRGGMEDHNSWARNQICPCCANELIWMAGAEYYQLKYTQQACKYQIKADLEEPIVSLTIKPRKKYKKRIWVKYHGDPVPTHLI